MQVDLRNDIKINEEEEKLLRELGFLEKEPVPYDEEKMKSALDISAVKQVRVFKIWPDDKKAKKVRKEKRKTQRKARKKNR